MVPAWGTLGMHVAWHAHHAVEQAVGDLLGPVALLLRDALRGAPSPAGGQLAEGVPCRSPARQRGAQPLVPREVRHQPHLQLAKHRSIL
eukprot:1164412-Prorocentrum_minimum.AAC.2